MATIGELKASMPLFLLVRRLRSSALFLIFVVIILLTSHYQITSGFSSFKGPKKSARELSVAELMARPLTEQMHTMPKLFHQSWSDHKLPAKMEKWSAMCRQAHPDWEWVLWTDEDNINLVRKYFPDFLKSYQAMQGEIYRADAMRNIYMYIFGGVYADLDVECLQPLDSLFAKYDVTTISHTLSLQPLSNKSPILERKAFFGRMGFDDNNDQSIPNAWMASTPGHPFFLLPMEYINNNTQRADKMNPESLTGPGALYLQVKNYKADYATSSGNKLEEHFALSPWMDVYGPRQGIAHKVEVLPFQYIYPYSWQRDGAGVREICWSKRAWFDPERCKKLLATEEWGSYTITYWSHSWAAKGHGYMGHLEDKEAQDKKKE